MTAQGSVYSQFKRALKGRNLRLAWTMAAELPKVPLADGLGFEDFMEGARGATTTRSQLTGTSVDCSHVPLKAARESADRERPRREALGLALGPSWPTRGNS